MVMNARDWALLGLLSVFWGGSFFFIAIALDGPTPLGLVAWRVALAALCLGAVVVATGRPLPRDAARLRALATMGFLNCAVPFTLIVWAQTQLFSGAAAILNAATPLFGVLVAGAFLPDEPITRARLAGVVVGIAGVATMVGPRALAGESSALLAQLAMLLATVFYAGAGVYGRRFRRMGLDPMVAAAGQLTAAALLMGPAALLIDGPAGFGLGPAPWRTGAAILGLATISTALAYVIYFRLLASAGATNLLLVTFLVPISAVFLGIAFLGEHLSGAQVAGMALIAAGLSAIDGRLWRRRGAAG